MAASIRNVIFDLDGTLVDSLPGIIASIESALAACGLPPLACDLKPLIGPPIRVILSTVSGITDMTQLTQLEQAFRLSYDLGGWRDTVCQPGAVDLIEQLSNNRIGCWLVTNKPAKATRNILHELKLANRFQEVACRDSKNPPFRSKADMLANLLRRHALDSATCLMVGDTLEDCQAAASTGMRCAVVPHGYWAGHEYPLPAGCRHVKGWDEISDLCAAGAFAAGRR